MTLDPEILPTLTDPVWMLPEDRYELRVPDGTGRTVQVPNDVVEHLCKPLWWTPMGCTVGRP